MAVMNVNPTRMELTNLKRKLVTAAATSCSRTSATS
jgi:hypothetical protein